MTSILEYLVLASYMCISHSPLYLLALSEIEDDENDF